MRTIINTRTVLTNLIVGWLLAVCATTVNAIEFRAQLPVDRGPLRLLQYDKDEKRSRTESQWWSVMYGRYADKAFTNEHGTATEPLVATLFNKADFRFSEIFPDSLVPLRSEYYNALLRTTKLHLRAEYYEAGLVFGLNWEHQISDTNSRFGLRASLPLRYIKMEKIDVEGVRDGANLQDVVSVQPVTTEGGDPNFSIMVRLDFAEALAQSGDRNSAISYHDAIENRFKIGSDTADVATKGDFGGTPAAIVGGRDIPGAINSSTSVIKGTLSSDIASQPNAGVRIGSSGTSGIFVRSPAVSEAGRRVARDRGDGSGNDASQGAWLPGFYAPLDANGGGGGAGSVALKKEPVAIYSTEGLIPRAPGQLIFLPSSSMYEELIAFPQNGSISGSKPHFFCSNTNYSLLADEAPNIDVATRRANQAKKANVWLIPVAIQNAKGYVSDTAADNPLTINAIPATGHYGSLGILKNLASQVTENTYEWLHDRGIDFETFTKEGLGDADAELFFEHTFAEQDTSVELAIGGKLPTGKKREYDRNPYYLPLGNGGHGEVRGSGTLSWRPSSWFNLKGFASYNLVLEGIEECRAAFSGATIKNFGPKAEASVEWQYFLGRVDATFVHPHSIRIVGLLGYEFYYKREEEFRFKDEKMQSWLGKLYDITSDSFLSSTHTLDNTLANQDTQAVGHRLHWELAYRHNSWLEMFLGGAWSFAGKNLARELDAHFGFNILF